MDTTLSDDDYNLYLCLQDELQRAQTRFAEAQNRLAVAQYAFSRFDLEIADRYALKDQDVIERGGRIRRPSP